jgi:succinate dehydrogenase / fumarate reductase, cytochrome b subunit
MGWFLKFIDSSVGKKLVMALTGLFLYVFLIEHLIANLLLLNNDNGEAYTIYAEVLGSSYNIPLRIIEFGLFFFLFYHTINGIRLWLSNKKAKGIPYMVNRASENSSFFSRFMIQSGSAIFIFLVIHLKSFFVHYRLETPDDTMYQGVVKAFQNPIYSWIYIIAMILLGFHLVHAFQSAFQTLGLRHNKYTPFIKSFGVALSILLCAGFILIPVYFLYIYNAGGN